MAEIINLNIPELNCKEIPLEADGQNCGDCKVVLKAASNSLKYSLGFASLDNKSEVVKTLFLEHFVKFTQPIHVNGKPIEAEDLIKYPAFAKTFDACVDYILKSMGEPEKN